MVQVVRLQGSGKQRDADSKPHPQGPGMLAAPAKPEGQKQTDDNAAGDEDAVDSQERHVRNLASGNRQVGLRPANPAFHHKSVGAGNTVGGDFGVGEAGLGRQEFDL